MSEEIIYKNVSVFYLRIIIFFAAYDGDVLEPLKPPRGAGFIRYIYFSNKVFQKYIYAFRGKKEYMKIYKILKVSLSIWGLEKVYKIYKI